MIFFALFSLTFATSLLTWDEYKVHYGKSYETEELHNKRQLAFQENVEKIKKHNSEGHSYWLGLNEWADLSSEEFNQMMLRPFNRTRPRNELWLKNAPLDSVDWRAKGAVTPVKNQGQCGSCWAFSTTGSTEGRSQIANGGDIISLSEQQLVDCDTQRDNGCGGGLMDYGFQYIETNGGITTEENYPYRAKDGTCNSAKAAQHAVTVTGFHDVPADNAAQMMSAVSAGPVSIAIEADKNVFQLYSGGVFDNPGCGTNLDHGVLVVGYGTEGGKDYWIVKNSWGASWGEQGYILLAKQDDGYGQCGMYKQPSYPVAGGSGPTPPPGPSPSPTGPYEDPANGCDSDEMAIRIQGVSGDFCAPQCTGIFKNNCPAPPSSINGQGQCVLQTSSGDRYCAVTCNPYGTAQCNAQAQMTCKSVQGTGLCTYDDTTHLFTQLIDVN